MGIVYIGIVEYKKGKRIISSEKNDIILKDAFLGYKHPTIKCKEDAIVLARDRSIGKEINQVMRR